MESRLAEIETKLSFSEELLEALNRTVYRQQSQIDQLQLELARLARAGAVRSSGGVPQFGRRNAATLLAPATLRPSHHQVTTETRIPWKNGTRKKVHGCRTIRLR